MPENLSENFQKNIENLSHQGFLRIQVANMLLVDTLTVRQIKDRLIGKGIHINRKTVERILAEISTGFTAKFQLITKTVRAGRSVAAAYSLQKTEFSMLEAMMPMILKTAKQMITDDNVKTALDAFKTYVESQEKQLGGRIVVVAEMVPKDNLFSDCSADEKEIVLTLYNRLPDGNLQPWKKLTASQIKADTVKSLLDGIKF